MTALHRNGHEFTVELTTTAPSDPAGRVVTIAREIDLEHQYPKAIELGAVLAEAILSQIEDACAVVDRAGHFRYVNNACDAVAAAPALQKAAWRARILIAEDNVVNQRVAAGLLGNRGHSVTVVGNGREALDALARESFDVVLMDVLMPVLDGLEATAALRTLEKGTGRHTRLIAMTAHAMNGDRERCIAAGMDGYVSKPLDPQKLYAIVEENASRTPASQ